ncbi:MAG TPA: VanW family protein [Kofleriaceae bacterium]|nr:VanW family protein [Kofleriaceae bacterium]
MRDLGELSRLELAARRVRVLMGRAGRLAAWTARPAEWPRPELGDALGTPHELYRRRWPIARAAGDPRLEEGKRINLALAAPHLDGLVTAPDRPLSFWRAVPRPSAARGYRLGMELRGGCVVPTAGGGLCLLSNALFAAAAELGWRILERHGHTMTAGGARGGGVELDATVMWPHVDLRVAPRAGRARLEVRASGGVLEVAVHGDRPRAHLVELSRLAAAEREEVTARGAVRVSAVRRVVRDLASGALVEDSLIAVDRKQVVAAAASRSCLTCDRGDCRARPAGLVAAPIPGRDRR